MDGVQLKSLRVTADMDVSAYTRAMQEKVAADARGAASSSAVGEALARQDVALEKTGAKMVALSKQFVDGYGTASRFEKAVRDVGRAFDTGQFGTGEQALARVAVTIEGVYKKFGLLADSQQLAKQGFVSIAPIVDGLNRHYAEQAKTIETVRVANRGLTDDQIASARAAQALANAQAAATRAQAAFNQMLGVDRQPATSQGATTSTFELQGAAIIAAAEAAAKDANEAFSRSFGIGLRGKVASESGAVFAAELNRLETIAQQKAEEAGRAFAQDFNQSMGIGLRATDNGATYSALAQQMERETRLERGRQQAVIDAGRERGETNKRLAAEEAARIAAIKRDIPTQDRLNSQIAEYDKFLKEGKISVEEHRGAVDLATKKFNDFQTAMQGTAGTGRRVSNELTNLSFQLNDVVTGLALGQSPFMIMAQQGGQVLQILQTGQGGISGTLRNIGGALASMVTPASVAVGSLVLIGGTAFLASERWSNAQREISRNLTGLGRDAGVTADQINRIAEATARLQGLSASSGRANIGALASTGRIDPAYLERIGAIQRDLAATLAVDVTEATQLLASAFADPIRGMEMLNERLGGLTDSTRSYIRTQIAAGNEGAAYQRMLDTFTPRLGRASELTSVWAQAWQRLKTVSSDTLDAIGRGVQQVATGGGQQSFSDQAQARLNALEAERRGQVVDRATGRELGNRSTFGQTQEDLQKELDGRQRVNAELAIQRVAMDAIRIGQEAITASTESMARASYDAARARRQIDAGTETARRMNIPEQTQADAVAELARNYQTLRLARQQAYDNQGQEGGFERFRAARDAEQAALRALRERLQNGGRGVINADGSFNVDLTQQQGLNRIVQQRVSLFDELAERARVERMEATAVTQAQKMAAAEARARLTAREQGAASGRQELVDAQATTAAETARVGIAHQLSEAAKERIRSGTLQIDQIRAETAAMGGSVGTQERVRVEQQLINDAKREYQRLGLSVPPAEIEAYRRLAAAMGEARQAQAELRAQRDIAFERSIIGMSDGEAQIARNLRQIYGDEGWRSQMDGTLAQQARFNENLKLTADATKGFVSDLTSGLRSGAGLFDALTSAATRFGARLQDAAFEKFASALISGRNPFEMFSGTSGSTGGSFGSSGLLSLSPARLSNLFSTSISEGVVDGFHEVQHGGGGISGATGTFGNSGLLGTAFMGGMSGLSGYGAGRSGGIGGIAVNTLGSAMQGFMTGGPMGALVNGAMSLIGGLVSRIGGNPERDKAAEQWRTQEASRSVYLASLRGDVQGGLAQSFAEQQQKVAELSQQASFARQNESVWKQMEADMWKFKIDTSLRFLEPFGNMLDALESGLGSNSPIAQAHQTVQTLRDEMLKFIDDTETAAKTVSADAGSLVGQAKQAAQAYALTLLTGAEEQTAVRKEFDRLNQTAISLQKVLVDLGMTSDQAAAAINENLTFALAKLKNETEDSLLRRSNTAMGAGYLNDIADAMERWSLDLADAQLLGIQKAFVDNTNLAEIQKIITGADLSSEAFDALIAKFPQLEGAVRRASSSLEDILARQQGYLDRYFNATNDNSTLAGQLRAFERQAARDREEEIKAGGEAMAELEQALAAERIKIIVDFGKQQQQVLEQAQESYLSFVRRIREFTDGLRAGAQSPLSPEARLAAAQSQYNAQLALAQGGNRDALNGITSYASDLLEASKAFNASSTAFQQTFNTVVSQLEALPTQVSAEQFIVNAINAASTANVASITDMRNVLTVAVNSGSASATASALAAYFNTLDSSVNNVLDFNEFRTGLNEQALAKNIDLVRVFNELDGNGNGVLERAELIRQATATVGTNTGTTAANTGGIGTVATNTGTTAANTNNTTNAIGANNILTDNLVTLTSQIRGLQDTANAQLQLLNANFGPSTATYGPFNFGNTGGSNVMVTMTGGALEYLRKIVFNTYAISRNTFGINSNAVSSLLGIFEQGGWVGGRRHSQGGTLIEAELGEFVVNRAAASVLAPFMQDINRGRMPVIPVPMPGNDNSTRALLTEIQALRAEVAALRSDTRQGAALVGQAVVSVKESVDVGVSMASDTNKEARRLKAKAA